MECKSRATAGGFVPSTAPTRSVKPRSLMRPSGSYLWQHAVLPRGRSGAPVLHQRRAWRKSRRVPSRKSRSSCAISISACSPRCRRGAARILGQCPTTARSSSTATSGSSAQPTHARCARSKPIHMCISRSWTSATGASFRYRQGAHRPGRKEEARTVDEGTRAVVRRGTGERCYRAHQGQTERRLILDQEGFWTVENRVTRASAAADSVSGAARQRGARSRTRHLFSFLSFETVPSIVNERGRFIPVDNIRLNE